MMFAILYWVFLVMWFAFGMWQSYPNGPKAYGGSVCLLILLVVIGLKYFPVAMS